MPSLQTELRRNCKYTLICIGVYFDNKVLNLTGEFVFHTMDV